MSPILLTLLAALLAGVVFYGLRLRRLMQAARQQLQGMLSVHDRNACIVEASGEGVLELDQTGKVVYANPAALRILACEQSELLGRNYRELLAAGSPGIGGNPTRIGYTTDVLQGLGAILRCKDGRTKPIEYRMLPLRQSLPPKTRRGAAVVAGMRTLWVFRDLSDRARLDVMLADMQFLAKVGAWEMNVGSARLRVSEGISHRLQHSARRKVTAKQILLGFTRASRHQLFALVRSAIVKGEPFDVELEMRPTAGETEVSGEWLRVVGKPEHIDGVVRRLYGAAQDVTVRRHAEFLVRRTNRFFGDTLDALPASVMYLNHLKEVDYVNRSPLSEWLGLGTRATRASFVTLLGDQHASHLVAGIDAAMTGQPGQLLRLFTRQDEHRHIQCNFVPQRASTEQLAGCWLVLSDVTETKQLEERLYQAEKMHAVGQLTSGLAHDFNNLLGVVLGNLQLLQRDLQANEAASHKLNTILRAALRGSDLTKRLLSFARRQPLAMQVVRLSDYLQPGFIELLQRSLGEQIQLQLQMQPEIWPVLLDTAQLENALLNLTLNARDAMPEGGVIQLIVQNSRPDMTFFREHPDLRPGDFVEIRIADNGQGIPPQVLGRIFEPFFTTKEIGKGSGLGLSMVHGFVKQSGGTVSVVSEVGKGTAISLFFPRDERSPAPALAEPPLGLPAGQHAILVVEDDTDLRANTSLTLQQLGYEVLEASNGEAALQLLKATPKIDILFTDVIMPAGMLGTELARRARTLSPNIKVLLTTGYLGNPVLDRVNILGKEPLLPKPYAKEELERQIRALFY